MLVFNFHEPPVIDLKQIESCSRAHHEGDDFLPTPTRMALALIKSSVGVWKHQPS